MDKKNNKPQIRFIGFTDPWEQRKFAKVFRKISNNTFSRAELNYENGTVKNIHYGDVLIKFGELLDVDKDSVPFVNEKIINKSLSEKLMEGDVIIADAAEDETVGKCTELINLNDKIVISGLHTIPSRPVINFASGYLGFYMNSSSYHNQLIRLMQGTKVSSISQSSLQETFIIFPSFFEEQRKISNTLSQLNNLITLHQRKLDKLEIMKKSLLEKMFPKAGNTIPEIRFKNFNEPWEQRKLGELGKATGGTSIESEFTDNGKYKVISIGSYSESSIYNDQGIRVAKTDKIQSRILNKNDLTMILNDKTASGNIIGRVLLIDTGNKYVYNQRTERIEVFQNKYDSNFLYHLLNADNVRKKIIKSSQGNTQIYVNWTAICKLKYLIPNSKFEQIKIGILYNNLDNLITLHQRQLEKLKNIKKSLLDKMFV